MGINISEQVNLEFVRITGMLYDCQGVESHPDPLPGPAGDLLMLLQLSECKSFVNSSSQPCKVPPAPRLRTIALPPVTELELQGWNYHNPAPKWTGICDRDAEFLISLAAAKPQNVENEIQSRSNSDG